MNRALYIKNWSDGGNCYVLKGNPKNKWVGYQESVIHSLLEKFGKNFNIIIWTDEQNDDDHFCIPFQILSSLFVEENKTTGKHTDRWTSVILNGKFLMANAKIAIDISAYYATPLNQNSAVELLEEYYIENAKGEVNIRLKQSKFRKGVLKNFNSKCALTGITETSLLTASHIVPWAHKKDYRADISNGICLYVEYDALFDQGYISFKDNLEAIIITNTQDLSTQLTDKLNFIKGRKLSKPITKELNLHYLEYHRQHIFKK